MVRLKITAVVLRQACPVEIDRRGPGMSSSDSDGADFGRDGFRSKRRSGTPQSPDSPLSHAALLLQDEAISMPSLQVGAPGRQFSIIFSAISKSQVFPGSTTVSCLSWSHE